jgi:iron(III) transport system substrate-binding protein
MRIIRKLAPWALSLATLSIACQPKPPGTKLVVYCGRSADLVQPLIDRFQETRGRVVEVRYGGTAELAALILEEGSSSPADVFYGQDAGALGALASEGLLRELPSELLESVDPRFRSPSGHWVGTSGRARVLLYNSATLSEDELPDSVLELTDPAWRSRVAWAPRNGSFQAFVTVMRLLEGEAETRAWLEGMMENGVRAYPDNTDIFEATRAGEIEVGLTNHYYLFRHLDRADADVTAVRNYSPRGGGAGALINVAGAGVLASSDRAFLAEAFVTFLLARESQTYFAEQTFEYPLFEGVETHPRIQPLSEIVTPAIDLSELDDLDGTIRLLQDVGAL